ncbi:polysaccharide biosynthesis C-terminal domain-containing protein [Psychrobacillus sp. INOP01]|uniref:oligosaccharide flippase family protein n=1 Tax=Psychrobacillus sp. INOP01 TaxID=2829187 RepID=UPI001BA99E71|nr:polysaccharide biosynthesis C-terminal domain-containing protein [Psychrobacillus sp. INOP01]QUG40598.1 polysaccharide biosynthesis C-terminal domain-containing protein [Psychrobacillus sp. INOP01]
MNRYKKLIANSVIFGIGNFGSKIILILLVPLYTFYLSSSEYGTLDIITITTSMLLPFISLSIYEAVLRFVMDKNISIQSVVTNAFAMTTIGIFIAILIYPILSYFNVLNGLLIYLYLILILQAIEVILSQYTRAIDKVKIYAISGILKTLTLGVSNILLLTVFKQGINGYLYSIIFSNMVSIVYFASNTDLLKNINVSKLNMKLMKNMLVYSIPLIPNAFMWFLMNASNRYFILHYKGVEINGLFAVASKIPALLTIFTSIFGKSWQLSAIEEYNAEDKSKFYTRIFYYYQSFLLLGTSFILVLLKPLLNLIFAEAYYLSWQYIPFLLLSVVFSSFSGFLGTNYIAAKETKGVFKTSLIGGLFSLVLNFILVPILGGIGAGLATMFSFIIIWIIRVYDTKRFIKITINMKNLVTCLLVIIVQITILFLELSVLLELSLLLALFILLLVVHRYLLYEFYTIGKKMLMRR